MRKRTQAAVIATAVLLAVGTLVSAQSGDSFKTGEQGALFTLDESAWCGGGRGGPGFGSGGCGGPGGYNGNPDDGGGYGNGSGFDCH
jgi:hypothetical protein